MVNSEIGDELSRNLSAVSYLESMSDIAAFVGENGLLGDNKRLVELMKDDFMKNSTQA